MNNLCVRSDKSPADYRQDLREIYGSIKTFRSIELTLHNRIHLVNTGFESALKEICKKVSSIKEEVNLDLDKVKNATCFGISVTTQRSFNRVFSCVDTGSVISGVAIEIFNVGSTHKLVILMMIISQVFSKLNDFVSGSLRDLQIRERELTYINTVCSDMERYSSDLLSIYSESADVVDGPQFRIDHGTSLKNRWSDTVKKLLLTVKKSPSTGGRVSRSASDSENSDDYDTSL